MKMYAGIETASAITSIAALTGWGLSFAGVNKYMRSHSKHDDNGFYMLFSIFVSLAVAIAVAAGSKLLMLQTASSDMGLVTAANIILAIAVMIIWGISFLGVARHLKEHSTKKDNGFLMLLSAAASLAIAMAAAAVGRKLLMMQTAPSGMDLLTAANITLAMAVVAIWGISFVGITRHLKNHSAQADNGFYVLLSAAASLVVAIVAAAVGSRISMLQTPLVNLGFGITPVDMGLGLVALAVLIGPFTVKKIEHNLEAFLFVMGVLSVTIAGVWEMKLVEEAFMEPVVKGIVPAVLVAGMAFHYGRSRAQSAMSYILDHVSLKVVAFVMIVGLGLMSSIITAIIAALLLVELVNCMPLERKDKINLVIIACFSIGLGAVLTPLGEPLSTIAISKLQGPPYNAGFFFLFEKLALYIIPGVLAMGVLGMLFTGKAAKQECVSIAEDSETLRDVGIRAAKVYVFVMALLLLGAGMKIIIDKYFTAIPSEVLYWVNMLSAILDNATLTAAEIAPSLSIAQITAALMGLLIAGGMLVPGNIPNIISANKLGITSKEWARLGIPLGLSLMLVYFVWIFYIPFGPLAG
jgi:predicted cation transporter